MTDFGDVFMRELQSCKFAVVDGDKKEIRAYAKKKRLNSDYNIKTFRNEKYTKIWFYKPWQKMSADKAEKDEIVITDNISDGEWDWDILTADWDKALTTSWGLDWGEVETAAEETPQELSEKYTLKITTPIYEVKGDKPDISELVDVVKTNAMLDEINAADGIPEDVKGFLRIAAVRLYRFNYEKIAEYYAHQPPEIQAIMEKLALVIIDFNKAIENGYVRLTKEIEGLLDDESDE